MRCRQTNGAKGDWPSTAAREAQASVASASGYARQCLKSEYKGRGVDVGSQAQFSLSPSSNFWLPSDPRSSSSVRGLCSISAITVHTFTLGLLHPHCPLNHYGLHTASPTSLSLIVGHPHSFHPADRLPRPSSALYTLKPEL